MELHEKVGKGIHTKFQELMFCFDQLPLKIL